MKIHKQTCIWSPSFQTISGVTCDDIANFSRWHKRNFSGSNILRKTALYYVFYRPRRRVRISNEEITGEIEAMKVQGRQDNIKIVAS